MIESKWVMNHDDAHFMWSHYW